MLSGTSPFKDASEWLIFQRIIARDIKFPDYFSKDAKDLIDKLLVSKFITCVCLLVVNSDVLLIRDSMSFFYLVFC